MNKLWDKNNNPETRGAGWILNPIVEAFETGEDLLLDQKLVKYDCWGTMAHAKGLYKIGILSEEDIKVLSAGLKEILNKERQGKFELKPGDEDVHTKIENFLTEKYGQVGKKVHAGRSRNDQVLTAIRLYAKEQLFVIRSSLIDLAGAFVDFAKKYEFVPIPGYTHMQKAMPSSVGMWAVSFVESFWDDLSGFKTAYELNDQSPLGSAAGYGVPLNLEREYTAKILGFERVQSNSLYCQNSRGKIEASILSALISILQTVNKCASDVLLFTTSEFNYFTIAKELCTGSSIMPQKRNVDVAELLRSKVNIVIGNYIEMLGISNNLISGYNRDLQDTKKPLFESLEITEKSLVVAKILLQGLKPNIDVLEKTMSDEIFSTHKALALVKEGVPFREAYKKIQNAKWKMKNAMPAGRQEGRNFKEILKESGHVGGTGNLKIKDKREEIRDEEKIWEKKKDSFEAAIEKLFGEID